MAAIDDINQHPVIHTWTYKLQRRMIVIRISETMN